MDPQMTNKREAVRERRIPGLGQQKTLRRNFAEEPTGTLGKQVELERGELGTTETTRCFVQCIQQSMQQRIQMHPLGPEVPEWGQGQGLLALQKSRAAS
jgi:hypothetical protein